MRSDIDEVYRRINILRKVRDVVSTEASVCGAWAREDMQNAYRATNEEMGHFYAYFSGVKAREAASFAILALGYDEDVITLEHRLKGL